jgi:cold shock CspA family protein
MPARYIPPRTLLMRIEGTLSKWNDERGFGFITPTQGGQDIFVHVSAFPKDGVRPTIGEKLSFEIETDSQGKKRAKNLLCPERRAAVRPARQPTRSQRKERPGLLGRAIPLLVLAGLAFYGYTQYSNWARPMSAVAAQTPEPASATAFRCDGRTHCSQMTSCAEAKFFLRNCPDVKMDGNNDGVPCEQQWCTGLFGN